MKKGSAVRRCREAASEGRRGRKNERETGGSAGSFFIFNFFIRKHYVHFINGYKIDEEFYFIFY